MTDRELADQADAAFRKTTTTYATWQKNVRAGKYPAFGPPSQFGIGFGLLAQIGQTVPPPTNPPFGTRPTQAPPTGPLFGPGPYTLTNKHIKWTNPTGSSLNLQNFTNVTIVDCDFEGPGAYVYLLGCTGIVNISNCRFKNVGHNAFQFDNSIMEGTITDIKVKGGLSEDVISVSNSGGPDSTRRMVFDRIHIEGGDGGQYQRWTSGSGSGIMNERSQHVTYRNFTLLNPGQVGIGMHLDTDVIVEDFSIHTEQSYPSRGLGNVAYDAAQAPQSSPLETRNGKVKWLLPNGSQNNYTVLNGGANIAGWPTNQWGYDFTPAEIAAMRVTL